MRMNPTYLSGAQSVAAFSCRCLSLAPLLRLLARALRAAISRLPAARRAAPALLLLRFGNLYACCPNPQTRLLLAKRHSSHVGSAHLSPPVSACAEAKAEASHICKGALAHLRETITPEAGPRARIATSRGPDSMPELRDRRTMDSDCFFFLLLFSFSATATVSQPKKNYGALFPILK
ncbi:uncharacterized protein K452DRAFT_42652 [Aplosporella prunicola CBS 121167]|uniref:Uncharacterized protein n=1 Tax=Aplosporella prunicola CBS 121167 TaxID=1176127 RepID=A0A6A6BCB0_9PEZI|nr:uncharacterized protein K452DRAFT_42652 [Aplosporella prunicola CBS 121167]KAF2140905.1 hypothetical protein K452DRAFT_42652 [Aplosporella prunicola CBS 121167]